MENDRQIIISKSLMKDRRIHHIPIPARIVLVALAMEVNDEGISHFPGWMATEYGISKAQFYEGTRSLKALGFIEPVVGVQSRYRLTDKWKQGKK